MFEMLNPPTRHNPSGYTHGVIIPEGKRMMFISGQLSGNIDGVLESEDFVVQFSACLDNVLTVLEAAGGTSKNIAKMNIYITDFPLYRSKKTELAVAWCSRFGETFPSMTIIAVQELFDPKGKVEIEAIAFVD
ncbi:RidA family protein [Catenovulum sp. SM1970]|uniref:RidA family protein n=1 Tax=Marinifaba aquimaris TaxID=2741323 RepID=UPI001574AE58|nr:RidA family protein [Marinifaba aquimaris]NTS75299.1 RidA family protein [Marinifaba aquimaris]